MFAELIDGRQIEFQVPVLNIFTSDRKPKATILRCCKGWRYLCRFHAEVWPKEREVNLSAHQDFHVLRHVPLINHLSAFDIETDAVKVNDFRQKILISSSAQDQIPKLSHSIGTLPSLAHCTDQSGTLPVLRSKTKEKYACLPPNRTKATPDSYNNPSMIPQFPFRKHHEKITNMFESKVAGVGAAIDEEQAEMQKELKRKQVCFSIDYIECVPGIAYRTVAV